MDLMDEPSYMDCWYFIAPLIPVTDKKHHNNIRKFLSDEEENQDWMDLQKVNE